MTRRFKVIAHWSAPYDRDEYMIVERPVVTEVRDSVEFDELSRQFRMSRRERCACPHCGKEMVAARVAAVGDLEYEMLFRGGEFALGIVTEACRQRDEALQAAVQSAEEVYRAIGAWNREIRRRAWAEALAELRTT